MKRSSPPKVMEQPKKKSVTKKTVTPKEVEESPIEQPKGAKKGVEQPKKTKKRVSKPTPKKVEEFYILELSVKPGGARKNDVYLLWTLTEVFDVLQKELINNADLAIWYGEEILLHRYRNNKIAETTDLHPLITFYVGDFPPIKFGPKNKVIGYKPDDTFTKYDRGPIDFTKKNIGEVHRYLYYDTREIFRIMAEKGVSGSSIEHLPPNVGVQVDLTKMPRIDEPVSQYDAKPRTITLDGEKVTLQYGLNDFA